MIIAALWKDSYKITVGDKECREIKTNEDEITCTPTASEPLDSLADNPRVRVGKKKIGKISLFFSLFQIDDQYIWIEIISFSFYIVFFLT